MKKCYITTRDEVYCFITGLQPQDSAFLWDKFGIYKDGYVFSPAYKLRRWDGKIRFYEQTGKTYLRLLDQILPVLDAWGYEIILNDERPRQPVVETRVTEDWFAEQNINLRDYQVAAVNALLDNGNGFGILGTGSGKTLVTAALSDVLGKNDLKVITIVPSSDLVTQTAEWYQRCGLDVGEYSGAKKELHCQHVVGTWQSLQNNPSLMHSFQGFIWDEAHGARAAVAQKLVCDYGKHISYRFGVTGTFPKPKVDNMSLIASIGPIVCEVPASWLIENGYLARIDIEVITTKEPVDEEFPDYPSERAYISKSEPRLDFIANLIIAKCEAFGNTLVLVNSIPFGQKLQTMIEGSVFLYGASEKDERREQYDLFAENNNLIVIASSGIASTGISIDRVFCLMMIDPGKSFVKAIQSVGRGTRMAHDKKTIHVVDVSADLKFAKKHLKERTRFYKEAKYPVGKPIKVKL